MKKLRRRRADRARRTVTTVWILLFCATLAFAVWNASKQENFFQRQRNLAFQMQDTREECSRVVSIWFTENVSASVDFVDHPSGVTTAEMTTMIAVCEDTVTFYEDVQEELDPFLSSAP